VLTAVKQQELEKTEVNCSTHLATCNYWWN